MRQISVITNDVRKLLKENDFFVFIGVGSDSDYVYHNNVNTIIIDSVGIKLYNEPTEYTVAQLDKQLKEFIKAYIPDVSNVNIKIERTLDLSGSLSDI
jgi:hypothetical protein